MIWVDDKLYIGPENKVCVGSVYWNMLQKRGSDAPPYCANYALPGVSIKKGLTFKTKDEAKSAVERAHQHWLKIAGLKS